MSANLLILNPSETEFLLIDLHKQLAKSENFFAPSAGTTTLLSAAAAGLAFIFDCHFPSLIRL
jgi:hypothetical protein